jgi:hypothetical protein
MANATTRNPTTLTPYTTDTIDRDLSVASAATYYLGTFIALNASGHAVKCTDASGLRFDGVAVSFNDSFSQIVVATTDTLGDKKVRVSRPFRFRAKIAAAAITDIGSPVYALYDNEVALSGTTHSILVGWVDAIFSSTEILVRPAYQGIRGEADFDGELLTFDGASAANIIAVPDNLADGLSIKEGSNAYVTVVTTDSAERILLKKQTRTTDSTKLAFGDGDDITIAWDGTDLDILQATANSSVKWGIDGAGIDQVFYGDTASTDMTWDQSADSLIFTGQAYIQGNKMKTVANTDGTLTIDATHSGKMITTTGASGATTVTLPTVAAGFTGVHFWIFNTVDQDLTLSAQTAGQIMFKNDLAANSVAASTSGEKIGAAFMVHCDGTAWLVMPMVEEAVTLTVTT